MTFLVRLSEFHSARSECLRTACALSMAGGFMDVYTYLHRGGVFANAVTGNVALLGVNLAKGSWSSCAEYSLAIVFYALGVLTSTWIHNRSSASSKVMWYQVILLVEIFCIFPVMLIPQEYNVAVNALVSFICAVQVQTFRRFHGNLFASTMCTGNLRSGSDALAQYFLERKKADLTKAIEYYLVIFSFIIGAVLGAILLNSLGPAALMSVPFGHLCILFYITPLRIKLKKKKKCTTGVSPGR